MKCIFTIFFLILLAAGVHSQVVVKGKILNYDGKTALYFSPTIEGVIPAYSHSREIKPDANGLFTIKIENKGIGTVRITFDRLRWAFFYSDSSEITFVLDQAKIKFPKVKHRSDHVRDSVKQQATEVIGGDFAEVNRYYNKTVQASTLAFTVQGCDLSLLIQKTASPQRAIYVFDSLIQAELIQINNLGLAVDNERVSRYPVTPEVKEFLKNQVLAFYSSIFLNGLMLKRLEQNRKLIQDQANHRVIYNEEWERLVELFFEKASKEVYPSANSFEYNEFILNMAYAKSDYKKYDFEMTKITDDELIVQRLLHPELSVPDSIFLKDDKAVLAFKIHNLSRFLSTQTFYSPVLLNVVNEMRAKYPSSSHLAAFEPEIEKLKAYLKSQSVNYEKAKVIDMNYLRFADLLQKFKGKIVLVDIWATWCGACYEDFNYSSSLKPFLQRGDVSVLYVSIDKPHWEKKWRENIKFNQLEGHHVLANDVLIDDMWGFLGGRPGVIPRYSIIGRDGQILIRDAARPQEINKFVEQIESVLAHEKL